MRRGIILFHGPDPSRLPLSLVFSGSVFDARADEG
jgi:hypothetical protein